MGQEEEPFPGRERGGGQTKKDDVKIHLKNQKRWQLPLCRQHQAHALIYIRQQ